MHARLAPVLALLLAACTAPVGTSEPSASPAPTKSTPAWLVGTWGHSSYAWGWDTSSELDSYSYTFKADGTGVVSSSTYFVDSYMDDETRDFDIKWSATADTLTINGVSAPILASPNCRFLTVDGMTYKATGDVAECPFELPSLSDAESKIAGSWGRKEKVSGVGTDGEYTLTLAEDRTLHVSAQPKASWSSTIKTKSGHGYWTLDGDHLTAVLPDGTVSYEATVTFSGAQLRVCDEWGCNLFSRR